MTDQHPADHRCYWRGCRLDQCCSAWRVYKKRHRLAILSGHKEAGRLIPATEVAVFVDSWWDQGVGVKTIARSTGVSSTTIHDAIRRGTIRSTTAAKILAFQPRLADLPDRVRVDGTGTRRRLQALVAIGWTYRALGEELGYGLQTVYKITTAPDGARVRASTARAVRDLYDWAWQSPPAPVTAYHQSEQTRARERAAVKGWPAPMAWDDDTIDDPTTTPDTATYRPQRARPIADVLADIEWLLEVDGTLTAQQIGDRLGVTRDAIRHTVHRMGRDDLQQRLNRNAATPAA